MLKETVVMTTDLSTEDLLVELVVRAQSLYAVFPGLLGQFTLLRLDHVTRNELAARNNEA